MSYTEPKLCLNEIAVVCLKLPSIKSANVVDVRFLTNKQGTATKTLVAQFVQYSKKQEFLKACTNLSQNKLKGNTLSISSMLTRQQQFLQRAALATRKAVLLTQDTKANIIGRNQSLKLIGYDLLAVAKKKAEHYTIWKEKLQTYGNTTTHPPYAVDSEDFIKAYDDIKKCEEDAANIKHIQGY